MLKKIANRNSNSCNNQYNFKNFIMTNSNLLIKIAFFGVVCFILFLAISMILYPDGYTPAGEISNHYNFWWNYISDLGMTKSFAGAAKLGSTIFFILAISNFIITGLIVNLLNLYSVWTIYDLKLISNVIPLRKKNYVEFAVLLCSVSGIFSSLAGLFIIIFPKDTMAYEHQLASGIFFFGIFIQIFIYLFIVFDLMSLFSLIIPLKPLNNNSKSYKNKSDIIEEINAANVNKNLNNNYNNKNYCIHFLLFIISAVLFLIALIIYNILPAFIEELDQINSPFNPSMQKICVIFLIINVLSQINLNKIYVRYLQLKSSK
ncbi:MAG: hypothetical protein ACTSRZ_17290 [Promethearchaeota archaeon]